MRAPSSRTLSAMAASGHEDLADVRGQVDGPLGHRAIGRRVDDRVGGGDACGASAERPRMRARPRATVAVREGRTWPDVPVRPSARATLPYLSMSARKSRA